MNDSKSLNGACHCGAVRFTVLLSESLDKSHRCNCSFCRMRGAVAASVRMGDVTVTSGAETLQRYQFNTMKAEHYFCSVCGIYTHHRRRSNPNQMSVNVACLEGVQHPSDNLGSPRDEIAGYLRYEPNAKP
jgi:hypothetical protein